MAKRKKYLGDQSAITPSPSAPAQITSTPESLKSTPPNASTAQVASPPKVPTGMEALEEALGVSSKTGSPGSGSSTPSKVSLAGS